MQLTGGLEKTLFFLSQFGRREPSGRVYIRIGLWPLNSRTLLQAISQFLTAKFTGYHPRRDCAWGFLLCSTTAWYMQMPAMSQKLWSLCKLLPSISPVSVLLPNMGTHPWCSPNETLQAIHRPCSPTRTFGGLQGTEDLWRPGESQKDGNTDFTPIHKLGESLVK